MVDQAGVPVRRKILRRLALLPLMLFLVASLSFLLISVAPGSYTDTLDNPRLSPDAREAMKARFGLDKPPIERYFLWLGALAHGDLGVSFLYKEPVTAVIGRAIGPTMILMGLALIIDFLLGIIVALLSIRSAGRAVDHVLSFLSLGIYSLPAFWVAGLAILLFSIRLGWLPASHMSTLGATEQGAAHWLDLLRHMVLPAGILGLIGAASTARYLRSELLEIRKSPYLLAARARGIPPLRILFVHSLRPALGPLITLLGLALPVLVSGSVIIETIFSWPGMGRVLWEAATARDIPVVMACVLLGAVAVILGNLVADILYAAADPRLRE